MNEIIDVLMRRDGLSRTEAREVVQDLLNETRDLLYTDGVEEAEEFWTSSTGLEIDYLLGIL